MKIGVAFASSGGNKMVRALRSFRRAEPDLPVHIVVDVASKTFQGVKDNPPLSWFEQQPNVKLRAIENTAYINGCLNEGMHWMTELGQEYGCLFHDDVIFSPLPEHMYHISSCFSLLDHWEDLQKASALTLGCIQAFIPEIWHRPPEEWDAMDLESEELWVKLFPDRINPAGYLEAQSNGTAAYEIDFQDFFVQFHGAREIRNHTRLGPTGQIVPVKLWNEIGGFDKTDGIFYDIEYPAECAHRGYPPVKIIPNVPHIHLHNQTIGFGDPALGLWSDTMKAFTKRYGDHQAFWGRLHKEWNE